MIKIKIKVYAIKTRSSMYIIFLLLKKAYTEILVFVLIFFLDHRFLAFIHARAW
jgi:hypothetical protein